MRMSNPDEEYRIGSVVYQTSHPPLSLRVGVYRDEGLGQPLVGRAFFAVYVGKSQRHLGRLVLHPGEVGQLQKGLREHPPGGVQAWGDLGMVWRGPAEEVEVGSVGASCSLTLPHCVWQAACDILCSMLAGS